MNGARLQTLIYNGYAKEAKVIGYDYDVYRATLPSLYVIDPGNLIATLKCAFIADAKAEVANKYQTPTWMLRADGNQLEVFDFLVGPFGTFFVASMQPQLPMEAIKCNSVVNIGRVDYTSGTGIVVNYVEGLPIFKQYRREDIRRDQTGNEIGNAITHWRAFIPLPAHTLRQADVLVETSEDPSISYTVDAPDFTSAGYAANIRLADI